MNKQMVEPSGLKTVFTIQPLASWYEQIFSPTACTTVYSFEKHVINVV